MQFDSFIGLALMTIAGSASAYTSAASFSTVGSTNQDGLYFGASQTSTPPRTDFYASATTSVDSKSTGKYGYIGLIEHADNFVSATPGVLKLKSVVSGDAYSDTFARGEARFGDTILINAPGRAGQFGVWTATMTVDWGFSQTINSGVRNQGGYDPSAVAFSVLSQMSATTWETTYSWRREEATYYADPTFNTHFYGSRNSNSQEIVSKSPANFSKTYTLSVPFAFGRAFSFEAILFGYSHGMMASNNVHHSGTLGADHSAYWGGSSVVIGGAPVAFQLSSSSGVDWSQSFVPSPVPEPATAGTLASGLIGLLFLARRRKRSL